jgi:hypothetical protein
MSYLSNNSFQQQQVRHLLDKFSNALLILKLQAQNQLSQNNITDSEATQQKLALANILSNIIVNVKIVTTDEQDDGNINIAYTGLSQRFIEANPLDVADRLEYLGNLRDKLQNDDSLTSREFQFLNNLQRDLETEVIDSYKDLFRF